MKIPALEKLLRDNAENCFDEHGAFDVPAWLQKQCWPLIAAVVPDFFSDAWNGDPEFEKRLLAFAKTDTVEDAQWLAAWTRQMFCDAADFYIKQYESDLVELLREQAAQSRD